MTLTVAETETVDTVPRRAAWSARAGAFTIDVLFGLAVIGCLLLQVWAAPRGGWLWWIALIAAAVVLLAVAFNRLVLPAATGWSLGRSLAGIRVVHSDGTPPGPWLLLLRDLAHLLDTVPLLLGWLWPLIDDRRRTFADVLTRTEVRYVDGEVPDRRRQVLVALASAAGLATVAAGLGYLSTYRDQVAAVKTRERISVEGPKLVIDMLSYSVKSVQEDFAHDQTLVSDSYRPELTKQQESVRKAGLVDNEYWVTNSAVLSSSADRAAMLLLLQGQRGSAPAQRFITASVRADYVKSSGRWLIDNLTVLTPPRPPAEAPAPSAGSSPAPSPGSSPGSSPAPKKPAPPAKPAPPGGGGR